MVTRVNMISVVSFLRVVISQNGMLGVFLNGVGY